MFYYNQPTYGQRPVYPQYPQQVPTAPQGPEPQFDEEDTREILEQHVGEIVVARIPSLFEGRKQVFIHRIIGRRVTVVYGDCRDGGGRCNLRKASVRARDIHVR